MPGSSLLRCYTAKYIVVDALGKEVSTIKHYLEKPVYKIEISGDVLKIYLYDNFDKLKK